MTVLHICCNLAGSTVFPQLFEALAAQGLEQVVFVPEKRAADLGKNEPRGVKTIRAMTVRQSDALFFFRKFLKPPFFCIISQVFLNSYMEMYADNIL